MKCLKENCGAISEAQKRFMNLPEFSWMNYLNLGNHKSSLDVPVIPILSIDNYKQIEVSTLPFFDQNCLAAHSK